MIRCRLDRGPETGVHKPPKPGKGNKFGRWVKAGSQGGQGGQGDSNMAYATNN